MNGLGPAKYVPTSPICTEPFTSRYTVQEDIGRGKFAVVRKCVNSETQEVVAAKVIRKRRKGKSCREEILREVVMLELAMAHPRLVSLREVFETQSELILVTEYCAGGELFHECVINESFKEMDVQKLLVQILEGLAYLHDKNIVHLDLKPQNILLTKPFPEGDIKICDLGFACLTNTGEDIRDIIGTPDYVAPEVLDYEPLNIQTDMWSLGVLTYVMLTTYSPFAGDDQQETFCNISQVKLDFPEELFGDISTSAQDFISKLLVKNPRRRLTAKECLVHPWLSDVTESLAISVPSTDRSSELALGMTPPRNWHMSADRRTSLSLNSSLNESVSVLGLSTTSEDKDSISKTLSHIDIDHGSAALCKSLENVGPSADQFTVSDVGTKGISASSLASGNDSSDGRTLSAFAGDFVQGLALGQNSQGHLTDTCTSISPSIPSEEMDSFSGKENAGFLSDCTNQEVVCNNTPVTTRENNKMDTKMNRMSMEIPLKKAKCMQEDASATDSDKSIGEATNGVTDQSPEDLRNSV